MILGIDMLRLFLSLLIMIPLVLKEKSPRMKRISYYSKRRDGEWAWLGQARPMCSKKANKQVLEIDNA